ncbi:prolactin regulatory element-binding protein-like [Hydractinia symbiolongicarpus]|uniref:prolactin regulatory element-binding protein-like n=1 Tax=Hydractinia symbiolongicarpus TaxID=13093 RepID=UPI00254C0468|nr:prolactin regulatory element-binding protein-like [Hydractinia symbiolongicarpus]
MTTYNLDETSFPLYGIQAINASMFVVAGGGGSAKTGVKNAVRVYKLVQNGKSYKADTICEVETGSRAVMNLHLSPSRTVLAIGMDHLCQFYNIKCIEADGKESLSLTATKSVDTVPVARGDDDGEYQKCVKFTPDQKHVITAASDGSCKIFKYPSLEEKFHIKKAHSDEIDEIDVHPNSKLFVSVSKESSAGLWRISDGKKELELPFSLDKKDEDFYRFRNCRFVESKDSDRVYLFSTNIPRKYSKGNPVNCLVKWNTNKWIPEQTVFIKHTLSALNASGNGRYVGVGTADGSVLIYISWNMRHLKTISGVHDIFVTGLSFIPENKELCESMKMDAGILSCSIDNKCQVTLVRSRMEFSFSVLFFFFVLVVMVIFNWITYFDVEF